MKFFLILLSIFFTLFKFADSSVSLTYGDFLSFGVLVLFANDLISKRLIINRFAKLWFYFSFFLILTSLFNFTTFEGRFLNIFKTNLFSLIFFIYVYSLIINKKLKQKTLLLSIYTLVLFFLVKTWPEMQKAWLTSDSDFTNVNIFDSALNLNTWGFVLVLFFIMSLYFYSKNIYRNISIVVSVILAFFIYFSYSRTAYGLSVFIFLYAFIYVNKIAVSKIIPPMILLIIIYIFKDQLNFFNFKVSESAQAFFEKKSSNAGNDLVNTRFYLINIKPLQDSFRDLNVFQIFVGDGLSVQHSWISHNIIVTGFVGFLLFVKRFSYAIKFSITGVKGQSNVIGYKFLLLIIIVILINDFITNTSSFLPFAAYLSSIITAVFFADIEQKKSNLKNT